MLQNSGGGGPLYPYIEKIKCSFFDRGLGREICEKEKYFKTKVVFFTVQSLTLYQNPVDLLNVLEFNLQSSKYLKKGKCGLDGVICQKKLFGSGAFKR